MTVKLRGHKRIYSSRTESLEDERIEREGTGSDKMSKIRADGEESESLAADDTRGRKNNEKIPRRNSSQSEPR